MVPVARLLARQQRLKPAIRAAGAGVVAAELFEEFLVAVDDAEAALDVGFRVESPSGACSAAQKQKRGSKRSWRMGASSGDRARPDGGVIGGGVEGR